MKIIRDESNQLVLKWMMILKGIGELSMDNLLYLGWRFVRCYFVNSRITSGAWCSFSSPTTNNVKIVRKITNWKCWQTDKHDAGTERKDRMNQEQHASCEGGLQSKKDCNKKWWILTVRGESTGHHEPRTNGKVAKRRRTSRWNRNLIWCRICRMQTHLICFNDDSTTAQTSLSAGNVFFSSSSISFFFSISK